MIRKIPLLLLALVGVHACAAPPVPPAEDESGEAALVIKGATLIDGTGSAPREDSIVVIRGNKIESVGGGETAVPANAEIVDASGKFLVPGLIEAHGHLMSTNGFGLSDEQKKVALANNPRAFLYNGVTTLVNLSSPDFDWIVNHRAQERAGTIVSPRIFAGAEHFTAPGGWGGRHGGGVTESEEVEERLKNYFAADIDLVKVIYENGLGASNVFPRMDQELMALVAERCREAGVPLMIHAMDIKEYRDAVAVTPRAIVHILEDALPADDPLPADIAAGNIFVTPTLVLFESFYRYLDEPELWESPALKASVPDFVAASLQSPENIEKATARMDGILKMNSVQWARDTLATMRENTKRFFDAGVKLTVGTDAGGAVTHSLQGYNLPREFEILVQSGLSPMDAIVAGTRNGAMMVGAEDQLGTIEAGKLADIVVLNRNPLDDIRNLRDIEVVILNGRMLERSELAVQGTPAPASE